MTTAALLTAGVLLMLGAVGLILPPTPGRRMVAMFLAGQGILLLPTAMGRFFAPSQGAGVALGAAILFGALLVGIIASPPRIRR